MNPVPAMRVPFSFTFSSLRTALVLAAVVSLTVPAALAQVCQGDVTLETQAQVDAFDCTEVTRHLYIDSESSDPISSLSNLNGLTSVGGLLSIRDNAALTTLTGLDNLTSVGIHLRVIQNAALTNLVGLASLMSVGVDLYVHDNAMLSECTVGLAPLLLDGTLGGTPYIYDNAPGCNSYWEALGGAVDAEDEATPLVTALAAPFPNPSAGAATLAFTLAEPSDVSLTVYDALGRQVATLAEEMQPAGSHEASFGAGFPAGTYVVRLTVGEEAWVERVTLVR